MRTVRACCMLVLFSVATFAQLTQSSVTSDELRYLRFLLMNVGTIDHSAKSVEAYEASLVRKFGLNQQEVNVIHAAGQRLNALLQQLRQQSQATLRGKKAVSTDDAATLASLAQRREELIETLANQILNQVRPETAAHMRAADSKVAPSQAGK